jgi:hypothetical protein
MNLRRVSNSDIAMSLQGRMRGQGEEPYLPSQFNLRLLRIGPDFGI